MGESVIGNMCLALRHLRSHIGDWGQPALAWPCVDSRSERE